MKKLRVYVDTSVIGGCDDAEFKIWSDALIEDFAHRRYIPVLSDITAAEISAAPQTVRAVYRDLVAIPAEIIAVNEEALGLVEDYAAQGVLGQRFRNDMLHIALASIAEVDVLVSWNFKHIVRLDKIRLFNAVNLAQAYKPLAIHSPREVISHDKEN